MNIKEFKSGDTAYILSQFRSKEPCIRSVVIKSVGNKYVTLDDGLNTQFESTNQKTKYLALKAHRGETIYLFKTEKDIKDFLEQRELVLYLSRLDFHRMDLSMEQLKRIKKIIEE